jgi:glutathione S-transferase
MLKVYGFARVNKFAHGYTRDLRVLWTLEEMGLPFEIVGLDHPNHALDTSEYRALNPFGQIPTIDDDGVVVTESGAILLYLARKTGKLMGRDLAGEAQVLRWCVAALNSIELPVLALWFVNISDGKGTKPSEALRGWATMRLEQLDGWLANREFLATDELTVADILMTHVLAPRNAQELTKAYTNVVAYLARCTARPAWQKTLAAYCERVEAT